MTNKSVFIVFPHQLSENFELLNNADEVYLVEEYLYFNQYKFHKQKLVFHRASMKYYESYLKEKNITVTYVEAESTNNDIRNLIAYLHSQLVTKLYYYDVCDYLLEKRIKRTCLKLNIELHKFESQLFINNTIDLELYFGTKSKYFQADF